LGYGVRAEAICVRVFLNQGSAIMPDINSLAIRIDAEFTVVADKIKKLQVEMVEEHKERQKRLEQLGKVYDQMIAIWKPRLELLVKKFGDRVHVEPRILPTTRKATFAFKSNLANVRLKFSAMTDRDVRKLILGYDLEIIPVLMRYKAHDEAEFPLQQIDAEAVAKWIDDRIVDFVQTYMSLGENDYYLKENMVEDPVAHVRFPTFAAGATLEWQGQKLYFVGEETRREFATQNGIAIA
jgi:hypothetical protein